MKTDLAHTARSEPALSVERLESSADRVDWQDLFSSPEKRSFVLSLLLILLTVAVYLPVRNNGFINFDDNQYIVNNPHVTSGLSWDTVQWAFTSFGSANWHPLTWISHAIDYQLFGMNAAGQHFENVLLHALNAVLLFVIFQSITGFAWRSWILAAVFAVHPLNVEAVAWAAERKTVLSVVFLLLATWAYAAYLRKPTIASYARIVVLYALALMSKPQVIIFPFALLLLDFWPLKRTSFCPSNCEANSKTKSPVRSISALTFEKSPFFVLSGLSAFITLIAQRAGNAVRTTAEFSLTSRIENAVISYVEYLRDSVWPRHLSPIYPHGAHFSGWNIALAAAALFAISVAVFRRRKAAPYLVFGWLWFLGTLVPMIGIVQVGEQSRADRYMYVPLIGVLVAAIWGVAELCHRWKIAVAGEVCLVVIVAGSLSMATYRQVSLWRNSETLWNYTLSVTKNNYMAEDNLAQELAHQGRSEEAMVHFHRALDLHHYEPSQLIALGAYEQHNGYSADAIKQYQQALASATDTGTRAVALSNMGSAYLDLKDTEQAQQKFGEALRLDANNVPALMGSGLCAQKEGNLHLAAAQYQRAVAIKPSDLGYELLGRALQESGRSVEANSAFQRAQQLSPDLTQTRSLADHLLAR